MKLIITLLLAGTLSVNAQVGIGTTNPTAALDINGETRIRTTTANVRESASKDSVLVVNNRGDVNRTTSRQIVNSYIKSFVKGGFTNTGDKSLALSSGTQRIPFDQEDFDINNEYDTSSYTFTAAQAGIYAVAVQVKATSALSLTTNFGVAIVKNSTVMARCGFANIGLLGIDVSPPFRSTQTLVQLAKGDTIRFNIYANLINVGILGSNEDCFFIIHQVR